MNDLWTYPEIVVPVHKNLYAIVDDQERMSALMERVHFRKRYIYGYHYQVFECQTCNYTISVEWIKENKIAWLNHHCTHPERKGQLTHCWVCGDFVDDTDGNNLQTMRAHTTPLGIPVSLCSTECLDKLLVEEDIAAKEAAVAQLGRASDL